MQDPGFEFVAPVLRWTDSFVQHYIPVPPEIADQIEQGPTRRLVGTINGEPVNRALHNNRDGERFLLIGRSALKGLKAEYGDMVEVFLQFDPNPDVPDIGEELREVLEMDEEASARFYSFTPGRQRSLSYYVTSAKREPTRIKRALEIAEKLRTYTLYGDQRDRNL